MNLLPDRKLPLPSWLPEHRRRSLSGQRVTVTISKSVRARLKTKERIPPSEWSEKYRVMGSAESFAGHWRRDIAPHAAKVMDLWVQPWVRELWFCGPDQASKTNCMLSCLGWSIDRDPGNIFYTASGEDPTKKILSEKLIPMLRNSPVLARRLSPKADHTGLGMIRLTHGVNIYPAWANSAAATATFSAKYTFNDEVDKWSMVGAETDPIKRIRKRAKNFPLTHKHFFASTPAGKYIYKEMTACRQVWEYAGRCPDCGELVIMDEEHFTIPTNATRESIEADPTAIEYACNHCGSLWDETRRLAAYRTGDWLCVKGADVARPSKVGVHLSGFVTPDMKMADIAITIVAARSGDLAAKRDLAHGVKAVDYEEETQPIVSVEGILRFRSELPRNLVPPDTARLALIADTQQSSFYYGLWSLGYAPEISLHLVRHGQVMTFADLEGLLSADWVDHEGRLYRVASGLIDSGGGKAGWQKHSRTVEVYEWCSRNRVMLPVKGIPERNGEMISYKPVATYPGSNKAIPGGLTRVNLRVDFFKDELERVLAIEPDDSGAISFHCDIDESFAKHFTTETKDELGKWIHHRSKGRNDYFDVTNYALALREMLKLRIPIKTEHQQPVTEHKTLQHRKEKQRRW